MCLYIHQCLLWYIYNILGGDGATGRHSAALAVFEKGMLSVRVWLSLPIRKLYVRIRREEYSMVIEGVGFKN